MIHCFLWSPSFHSYLTYVQPKYWNKTADLNSSHFISDIAEIFLEIHSVLIISIVPLPDGRWRSFAWQMQKKKRYDESLCEWNVVRRRRLCYSYDTSISSMQTSVNTYAPIHIDNAREMLKKILINVKMSINNTLKWFDDCRFGSVNYFKTINRIQLKECHFSKW